jgi:uncharacterized protein YvpB
MVKTVLTNSLLLLMTIGLTFSSGVFSLLLYSKMSGKEFWSVRNEMPPAPIAASLPPSTVPSLEPSVSTSARAREKIPKALLEAPIVRQNPELPSGCEITALTMLLQFYGVKKGKMELVPEMKKDPTEIVWNEDGTIQYWGNPNLGYVGDITGKRKGFGIYHAALFELLEKYVPTAVDLTDNSFEELEQTVSDGIPVMVWTTIQFKAPSDNQWVIWDSPLGPIRTTFQEHTVLLVGYDQDHVYVNDPLSGKKAYPIPKKQFIESWEALGKQALTYTKPNNGA